MPSLLFSFSLLDIVSLSILVKNSSILLPLLCSQNDTGYHLQLYFFRKQLEISDVSNSIIEDAILDTYVLRKSMIL